MFNGGDETEVKISIPTMSVVWLIKTFLETVTMGIV